MTTLEIFGLAGAVLTTILVAAVVQLLDRRITGDDPKSANPTPGSPKRAALRGSGKK